MENKCNKYESLFVFSDEESLKKHLEICPDCQKEHSKMLQVASLAKEVKPFIKTKNTYNRKIFSNIAACIIISFVAFASVQMFYVNPQVSKLKFVKANSVITQMGLPTDEYGLLEIE